MNETPETTPTVQELETREQRRSRRAYLGPRARTTNVRHITKKSIVEGRVHLALLDDAGVSLDSERPRTRGDCAGGARPCPWVSCRHNLYLDASHAGIKFNFPDREPEEIDPGKSCSLDVADYGGSTLEDVGLVMNVTRERIRQLETKALAKLRRREGDLREHLPDGELDRDLEKRGRGRSEGSTFKMLDLAAAGATDAADEPAADDEAPIRLSFFADPESERVGEFVRTRVWWMFAKCRAPGEIAASLPEALAAAEEMNRAAPPPSWEALVTHTTTTTTTTPTPDTETPTMMKNEDFAAAHASFTKANGRPPSAIELQKTMGPDKAKSLANVRQAIKRAGLVLSGARGPYAKDGEKREKPEKRPRKARAPKRQPAAAVVGAMVVRREPRPKARSSELDPLIVDLLARREAMASRVAALDAAIDALRPAS